jgi:hypothetical protein
MQPLGGNELRPLWKLKREEIESRFGNNQKCSERAKSDLTREQINGGHETKFAEFCGLLAGVRVLLR